MIKYSLKMVVFWIKTDKQNVLNKINKASKTLDEQNAFSSGTKTEYLEMKQEQNMCFCINFWSL